MENTESNIESVLEEYGKVNKKVELREFVDRNITVRQLAEEHFYSSYPNPRFRPFAATVASLPALLYFSTAQPPYSFEASLLTLIVAALHPYEYVKNLLSEKIARNRIVIHDKLADKIKSYSEEEIREVLEEKEPVRMTNEAFLLESIKKMNPKNSSRCFEVSYDTSRHVSKIVDKERICPLQPEEIQDTYDMSMQVMELIESADKFDNSHLRERMALSYKEIQRLINLPQSKIESKEIDKRISHHLSASDYLKIIERNNALEIMKPKSQKT